MRVERGFGAYLIGDVGVGGSGSGVRLCQVGAVSKNTSPKTVRVLLEQICVHFYEDLID